MRTKKAVRHEEQIDREIEKAVSRFSQHFMSNSKWVRLINKLVENADKILKIEFKKIQQNEIGELYIGEDTAFDFDYWQIGFEGNNSLGGWLTFREIEYLIFPKTVNVVKRIEQDLEQIEAVIKSAGKFFLETDDKGLKLICCK